MSRKTLYSSDVKNMEKTQADDASALAANGAKMALVKPVEKDNDAETAVQTSPPRPKIGRVPANPKPDTGAANNLKAVIARTDDTRLSEAKEKAETRLPVIEKPPQAMAHVPQPVDDGPPFAGSMEDHKAETPKSSGPWDFKFALIFVALLVIVNFALVTLLHNHHQSMPVISTRAPAPDTTLPAMDSRDGKLFLPVPSVTVSQAATVPPAAAIAVPPPSSQGREESPSSSALKDLPSPQAPSTAIQADDRTEKPVATPESRQDLLRILNRE